MIKTDDIFQKIIFFSKEHYKVKLCFLLIVGGLHNTPKNRIDAESAILLVCCDLLDCFGFHEQIAKSLFCSNLLKKIFTLAENETICGITHNKYYMYKVKTAHSRNRRL